MQTEMRNTCSMWWRRASEASRSGQEVACDNTTLPCRRTLLEATSRTEPEKPSSAVAEFQNVGAAPTSRVCEASSPRPGHLGIKGPCPLPPRDIPFCACRPLDLQSTAPGLAVRGTRLVLSLKRERLGYSLGNRDLMDPRTGSCGSLVCGPDTMEPPKKCGRKRRG